MHILNCRGKLVNLSRPMIMAIVNCSPDSFYKQSVKNSDVEILAKADAYIAEGADIIDLGACSTRPNSAPVKSEEEIKRLGNGIQLIKEKHPNILVSIDSYNPETVKYALEQGADIINDVSADGIKQGLASLAAEFMAPYILMDNPSPLHKPEKKADNNTLQAVIKRLNLAKEALHKFGVNDVIVDVGFGFGKSMDDNYNLLKNIRHFKLLDAPIMIGLSRKRMVCEAIGKSADEAGFASAYLNAFAAQNGANIIRTHDVALCKELMMVNEHLVLSSEF